MSRITFTHHPLPVSPTPSRRARSQRGVTIVEAAFALPIFFVLLLGLTDIGLGVFQTSQATSAATDGARVGIVWPADSASLQSHYSQIRAAVRGRLVGQTIPDSDIVITCKTVANVTIDCSSTALNPLRDRVQVTVKWRWKPISYIGNALPIQDIQGDTTMALISQPRPSP